MQLSPQLEEAIQSRARMLAKKFPRECEYEDLVQEGLLLVHGLPSLGDDYAFGAINKHYSDVWDKAVVRAPFNNSLVSLESMEENGQEVVVGIKGSPSDTDNDSWNTLRHSVSSKLSDTELHVLNMVAEKASLKDIAVDLGVSIRTVVSMREEAIRKLQEVVNE